MRKILTVCVTTLIGLITAVCCLASVPSTMSYQGKLTDSSGRAVADGAYAMNFAICDAVSGGNLLWTENQSSVQVVGGLFTVRLGSVTPLPDSAFAGNSWLRTIVNGTVLAPRVQILSVGYAIRAKLAETVPDGSITAGSIVSGQVVKSVNGLRDDITLFPGSNITITPNGNILTISTTAGSDRWSLAGNAGTIPGTNFLGTTDNQPLELRANNEPALRLRPDSGINSAVGASVIAGSRDNVILDGVISGTIAGGGYRNQYGSYPNVVRDNYGTVGGGLNNQAGDTVASTGNCPYATVAGGGFNVASGGSATVGGGSSNTAGGLYSTVPGGLSNTALGDYSFAAGRRAKANYSGSFVWGDLTDADFAATAANQFLIRAGGGVGIGATDPQTALDVNGIIRSRTGGFQFPDGTVQASAGAVADNSITSTKLASDAGSLAKVSGGAMVSASGSIGIGSSTPDGPFQVYGRFGNQDQGLTGKFAFYATGTSPKWQSFTCGTSGWLVAVMARFGTATGLPWSATLTIYAGEGTGGTALTSQAVSGTSMFEQNYLLQSPVSVTAGQKYTFSFDLPGQDSSMTLCQGSYAGGISSQGTYDAYFLTYVAAQSEPQPILITKTLSGAVGIGTRNPYSTLSVAGSADVTGTLGIGTSNPTNPLSVVGSADVSGKLTVGASAAAYTNRLDISGGDNWDLTNTEGDVRIGNSSYRLKLGVAMGGGGAGAAGIRAVGGVNMLVLGSGTSEVAFIRNGRLGIATSDPQYALHVNGTVAGVGAYVNLSDLRYKTNVSIITDALSKVEKLRGVTFDWKTEEHPELALTRDRQVGLIAQEVEKVLPEAVSKDEKGTYSVAYGSVVPLLVEAVKTQNTRIDQLKSENGSLQKQIDELKKLIAGLAAKETETL